MHMKANTANGRTVVPIAGLQYPHNDRLGRCHCGGVVVFRYPFKDKSWRIHCDNCNYEDPKWRELGWVDALIRKAEAQQAMTAGTFTLGLVELLDEARQTAVTAGRMYDAVRFEFMASVLEIHDREIDELDASGWFADPLNVACAMRPSQADRDELIAQHEDLQRLIDQAKSGGAQ